MLEILGKSNKSWFVPWQSLAGTCWHLLVWRILKTDNAFKFNSRSWLPKDCAQDLLGDTPNSRTQTLEASHLPFDFCDATKRRQTPAFHLSRSGQWEKQRKHNTSRNKQQMIESGVHCVFIKIYAPGFAPELFPTKHCWAASQQTLRAFGALCRFLHKPPRKLGATSWSLHLRCLQGLLKLIWNMFSFTVIEEQFCCKKGRIFELPCGLRNLSGTVRNVPLWTRLVIWSVWWFLKLGGPKSIQ